MNGGVAQAFPIPGKKGTGPFFSLKYKQSVIADLEMLRWLYKKGGEQGCSPPRYED